MTTTISLASRDFIAIGSDSLATTSFDLIDPYEFVAEFFNDHGQLKSDVGGPILNNAFQVFDLAKRRPVDQLPSVTKLFSLEPKKAAVVIAGASRIGDISVRNIVEGFQSSQGFLELKSYTMKGLADLFRDYLVKIYEQELPEERGRPSIEILISGYSESSRKPEIFKVETGWDWSAEIFYADVFEEVKQGDYNIKFGGQHDVIQRVVFGVDIESWGNLKNHSKRILDAFKDKIQGLINHAGIDFCVPEPDIEDPDLDIFGMDFGGVTRSYADVGSLSPKAGIEFVEFLISTMIKSQEFSPSIPTVGGEIHLALITKQNGFEWIRKPTLSYEEN